MIEAYRRLAAQVPYPLHLGVTEAGLPGAGTVKSAIGIGTLLADGIGDTIRVSLTADPVEELGPAFAILQALGLRQTGPEPDRLPVVRPHERRGARARGRGRRAPRRRTRSTSRWPSWAAP